MPKRAGSPASSARPSTATTTTAPFRGLGRGAGRGASSRREVKTATAVRTPTTAMARKIPRRERSGRTFERE